MIRIEGLAKTFAAPRAAWFGPRGAPVQAVRALPTRLVYQIDDRIHPVDRHQCSMVPRMPRLATRFASTLHAATTLALPTREAIQQQILLQKLEAAGRRYMRDLRRAATVDVKP